VNYRKLLFYLFLLAFIVRVWGIWFSLPFLYHPDEPKLVRLSVKIIATHNPNPGYFFYPSLPFYIQALLYLVILAPWMGVERLGQMYLHNPSPFFLLTRFFNALIGTITLYPLKKIVDEMEEIKKPLLPLLLYALAPFPVEVSHYATVDTLLTFLISVSLYFILRASKRGDKKDYFWGAVFCGMAGAVKYPGFLLLFPLLFSLLHNRKYHLLAFLLLPFLIFFLLSPYSILDFSAFKRDTGKLLTFSHSGWEGASNPLIYLKTMFIGVGPLVFIFFLIGFIISKKNFLNFLLLSFLSIYLILFLSSKLCFARFILPLFPLMSIYSAIGFENLCKKEKILLLILFPNIVFVFLYDFYLPLSDPRTLALQWVYKNIPPGSKIAVERYTPPLNVVPGYVEWRVRKGIYEVLPVNHYWSMEKFMQKGVEYIVISEVMYKRWSKKKEGWKFYQELERKGELVKYFPSPKLWCGLEFEKPWSKIYRLKRKGG